MKKALKGNVISNFKSQEVYGKAGEVVTVITYSGNIAIVENEKGNRYSCKKDNLVDPPPEKEKKIEAPVIEIETPALVTQPPAETKPWIPKVKIQERKPKKGPPPNIQSELFP